VHCTNLQPPGYGPTTTTTTTTMNIILLSPLVVVVAYLLKTITFVPLVKLKLSQIIFVLYKTSYILIISTWF
jgi:hypothetical protein